MKTSVLILSAALFAGFAAGPALADDDDYRGYFAISHHAAADIAAYAGLASIDKLERDDFYWEVEGYTFDGCEIELEIHGQTGQILKREIDDCDDRSHYGDDDWDDDDRWDDDDDDWDDD